MSRTTSASPLLALAIAGCAATSPPPAAPGGSAGLRASLDEWVGREAPPTAGPRARRLAPAAAGPVEIRAAPEAREARPRRGGKVDVDFAGADMVNALQFLADAGHFNLVLESGLTGVVSALLRSVDPYDALVMLAEANGATVAYDRQIVTVRRR